MSEVGLELIPDLGNVMPMVKNPFSLGYIKSFRISGSPNWGQTEIWTWRGYVEMQNGSTGGSQSFTGESMAEVLQKMELFIKSLNEEGEQL